MELLKRLDEALGLIESMTDTFNEGNYQNKLAEAIDIARNARWENGKLLTSYLYKESN